MSKEGKNTATDVLSGGAPQGDTTDWKAKYEEVQRELNSAKVDQGRVKKLTEENRELQRRLDERTKRDPSDYLSDDERALIDDGQRGAISKMVEGRVSDAVAASREEMEALKAELAQQKADREAQKAREFALRKNELDERFEREFPGLGAQLGAGGDKHNAWMNYRRFNGASIDAALANFDFDALAWHIRKFFTDELGIEPPSGGSGHAAPEPGTIGGGQPVVHTPGKNYTADEINDLFDKKEAARDREDWAEVKRLTAEINRAQVEADAKK